MIEVGSVVQFNGNHKWARCLGIVDEVKQYEKDCRYLIDVPVVPEDSISPSDTYSAYIYVMESDNAITEVGRIGSDDMERKNGD